MGEILAVLQYYRKRNLFPIKSYNIYFFIINGTQILMATDVRKKGYPQPNHKLNCLPNSTHFHDDITKEKYICL